LSPVQHLFWYVYNWRSKYAGLEVNEAKRLKELESENGKLKKPLAAKLLENETMKDVLVKSGIARSQKACCQAYDRDRTIE
jgi:putative transposase